MRTPSAPVLVATAGAFLGVLVLTSLLAGDGPAVVAFAAAAVVIAAGVGAVALLARNRRRHHGSAEAAAGDNTDPLPSTPLVGDRETALGDTREAHDELSPHDLPMGHPGRAAAERLAGPERRGHARTTRGGDELARATHDHDERADAA
jgi:hypothetical protein